MAVTRRSPVVDGAEALLSELGSLFRIERSTGQGPAAVHVAWDLEQDRRVALRVIPFHATGRAGVEDGFHRALAAVAVLDHPHIVPVYRSGATPHFLWYTRQYVEGRSLADAVGRGGAMELQACLRVLQQVASALHHAHGRGIVHGGLKPANVLLDAGGWALVTDFRVARLLHEFGMPDVDAVSPRHVAYAAPEHVSSGRPGPHADQYSLAVLAYESLTGALPFSVARSQPPPRLSDVRPEIAAHVSAAVERALSNTPGSRFSSVLEFVAALEGGSAPSPPQVSLARRSQTEYPVLFIDTPRRLPRKAVVTTVALALGGAAVLWMVGAWPGAEAVGSAPRAPAAPRPAAVSGRPDSTGAKAPAAPPSRSRPRGAVPPSAEGQRERWGPLPGRLFISAVPWGQLYIDDSLVGNTPRADVSIAPGLRRVRVARDGFVTFERSIYVVPGQQVRLTNIVLQELQR